MDELSAWRRFETTGRIDDYLTYNRIHTEGETAPEQSPEAEHYADHHHGDHNTGKGT
ncbi:MAG: hypothetical protein KH009_06295 [Clostridiales bacterium]|nr:hypothetical protein [Clostridiales bacterium]